MTKQKTLYRAIADTPELAKKSAQRVIGIVRTIDPETGEPLPALLDPNLCNFHTLRLPKIKE